MFFKISRGRRLRFSCNFADGKSLYKRLFLGEGTFLPWNYPSFISWEMYGVKKISVALYRNNKFFKWIVKDMPVDKEQTYGYHEWLPSTLVPQNMTGADKKNFKFYIIGQKAIGKGTVTDKSEFPFAFIVAPSY